LKRRLALGMFAALALALPLFVSAGASAAGASVAQHSASLLKATPAIPLNTSKCQDPGYGYLCIKWDGANWYATVDPDLDLYPGSVQVRELATGCGGGGTEYAHWDGNMNAGTTYSTPTAGVIYGPGYAAAELYGPSGNWLESVCTPIT
jgi:hypothetical protein